MTRLLGCGTLVVVTIVVVSAAGLQGQPASALGNEGAQIFKTWCSSCHGLTGQGNGPLAPMLTRVPPDLTMIASKNGGMFPTARMRRVIDGRDVESHGDPEMPIWGSTFKSTKGGYSEESVRARIDAVVAYLESIQKRNAH